MSSHKAFQYSGIQINLPTTHLNSRQFVIQTNKQTNPCNFIEILKSKCQITRSISYHSTFTQKAKKNKIRGRRPRVRGKGRGGSRSFFMLLYSSSFEGRLPYNLEQFIQRNCNSVFTEQKNQNISFISTCSYYAKN